jgi:hypothetical protein
LRITAVVYSKHLPPIKINESGNGYSKGCICASCHSCCMSYISGTIWRKIFCQAHISIKFFNRTVFSTHYVFFAQSIMHKWTYRGRWHLPSVW